MAETPAERAAAREAFSDLAHETRLDILLALLSEWRAADTEPQRYASLMDAVGMEDSGQFNYHLQQLRGTYVRKVEGGYVPTGTATALYRAVLAYEPTVSTASRSFTVDETCPDCGTAVVATYERDFLSVACPDCEARVGRFTYAFPSNGLSGRDDREVLAAVHQRARHHVSLARTGQCPFCAGTTTVDLFREQFSDPDAHDIEITCDTCTFVVGVSLLFAVSMDARVTAALVDLGVPVDTAYTWAFPQPEPRVSGSDPLRVTVKVEREGKTASITVDETLDVTAATVDGVEVGRTDD
jgi:hypothetical protein